MEHLWRLATAIFLIAVSLALFVVGWIFSDGRFHHVFAGVLLYVVLAGILWGICRGVAAIIAYGRENKK